MNDTSGCDFFAAETGERLIDDPQFCELIRARGRPLLELARGLTTYASSESRLIAGKASGDIESILGYIDEPELIHRDNLILLA